MRGSFSRARRPSTSADWSTQSVASSLSSRRSGSADGRRGHQPTLTEDLAIAHGLRVALARPGSEVPVIGAHVAQRGPLAAQIGRPNRQLVQARQDLRHPASPEPGRPRREARARWRSRTTARSDSCGHRRRGTLLPRDLWPQVRAATVGRRRSRARSAHEYKHREACELQCHSSAEDAERVIGEVQHPLRTAVARSGWPGARGSTASRSQRSRPAAGARQRRRSPRVRPLHLVR